ncbi:MAG TPA: cytochrome c [Sideroxyarcus sp.]|nr:cytochrome c [Sideroxyarcus sp.]
MKFKLALAVIIAASSTAAVAGQAEDQQVKFRQSAYSFAAWNCSKIKNQVVEHPETFNKDQVIAAANAIAAVANSGLGALYGAGTDQATGWKKSRLKPEFFDRQEDAKKAAIAFNKEANELAKVAASGDAGAIKVQFGKVGETCKSCHDSFRIKD